jgi:hypothetical protein
MDNVQNSDNYINIPEAQTYRSYEQNDIYYVNAKVVRC